MGRLDAVAVIAAQEAAEVVPVQEDYVGAVHWVYDFSYFSK
jgi:hypothetical protein